MAQKRGVRLLRSDSMTQDKVDRFQPPSMAPIMPSPAPAFEPPPMPEPWVENCGTGPADRPDNPYYLQG